MVHHSCTLVVINARGRGLGGSSEGWPLTHVLNGKIASLLPFPLAHSFADRDRSRREREDLSPESEVHLLRIGHTADTKGTAKAVGGGGAAYDVHSFRLPRGFLLAGVWFASACSPQFKFAAFDLEPFHPRFVVVCTRPDDATKARTRLRKETLKHSFYAKHRLPRLIQKSKRSTPHGNPLIM